jgi:hypothetical protein
MNQDNGQVDYECNVSTYVNPQRTISFVLWGNSSTLATLQSVQNETSAFVDPTRNNPVIGSNMGRLSARKYLSGDIRRAGSCPSTIQGPGSDITGANNPYFYSYNLHWVARLVNGAYKVSTIKKLSLYHRPKGTFTAWDCYHDVLVPNQVVDWEYALAADPIYTQNASGNGIAGLQPHFMGTSRCYNLLYADGSVKQAIVPNNYQRQNTGSYNAFVDALGFPESIASGSRPHGVIQQYVMLPIVQ